MKNEKLCGEKVEMDGVCILHHKNAGKKKEKFKKALKKKFDEYKKKTSDIYDFSGYFFVDGFNWEEYNGVLKVNKSVIFSNTEFHGKETNFCGVEFNCDADFSFAEFFSDVTVFRNAGFYGKMTSFAGANFQGNNTSFSQTKFHGDETYFLNTEFRGKLMDFVKADFRGGKTHFYNSKFLGELTSFAGTEFHGERTDFSTVEFRGKTDFSSFKFCGDNTWFVLTKFYGEVTYFVGAEFIGKNISFSWAHFKHGIKGLFEKGILKKKHTFFRRNKYKIKNINLTILLDDKISAENPILARKCKDAIYLNRFKEDHKIAYFFWLLLADCGNSLLQWVFWSCAMAAGFAWKFCSLGPEAFNITGGLPYKFATMLYYSVVTFTTLGFGDITPKTSAASHWVMAEVIVGYIMLGGLISILAVKLARRS